VAQTGWLAPKDSGPLALFCIHHSNRVNSCNASAMTKALELFSSYIVIIISQSDMKGFRQVKNV